MESTPSESANPERPLNDPPPVKRSAVVRFFVAALAVGVVVPSVLGFLGRTGWQMDLLTHFRFQYALILLFTTVGLLLLRSGRVVWVSLLGLILMTFKSNGKKKAASTYITLASAAALNTLMWMAFVYAGAFLFNLF